MDFIKFKAMLNERYGVLAREWYENDASIEYMQELIHDEEIACDAFSSAILCLAWNDIRQFSDELMVYRNRLYALEYIVENG